MPSLITLIPAYKHQYLADLFLGLQAQTFKDFKVVLSDDSPGGAVTNVIRQGTFDSAISELNLLIVPGPRLGSFKNVQHLLANWGAETPLVHIHLDDDILYPEFYDAHSKAHLKSQPGASVSRRWVTNSEGHPTKNAQLPEFLNANNEHVVAIGADQLYASIFPHCQNWLGEFSNTVFSAEAVRRLREATMQGLSYYGLADIGILLDVSRYAPIALIRDHLSGFRSNPMQASANKQSFDFKCAHLAWVALALAAWRDGQISAQQARQSIALVVSWCEHHYAADLQIGEFFAIARQHAQDLEALCARFEAFWMRFLNTGNDFRTAAATLPRSTAGPSISYSFSMKRQ